MISRAVAAFMTVLVVGVCAGPAYTVSGPITVKTATGALVGPAAPPIPEVKTARLAIKVTGYVETEALTDTTSDCYPGVTYKQANSFRFTTQGYRNVSVKRIRIPGRDTQVFSSRFSKSAGSARIAASYSDYRTTNFCPPDRQAPESLSPLCTNTNGKLRINLAWPNVEDTEGDLTPIKNVVGMLSIMRTGGRSDDPTCYGPGAGRITGGSYASTSVVTTSPNPGVSLIVPGGDRSAREVFRLKKGKVLRNGVVVDGPCTNVTMKFFTDGLRIPEPRTGALNADGDCWLRGRIVAKIKARG